MNWIVACALLALLLVPGSESVETRAHPQDYRMPRGGVGDWQIDPEFKGDAFTFVRVRYYSNSGRQRGWRGYRSWRVDYPDSDLNFSFRLQQLTTLVVNPDPIWLELTDPQLFDYPFLYMIEPGALEFREPEIAALRRYLLNGGFMMVDDFWGDEEWENFRGQMKRVFPDREPTEVPLEHEIFHCVYDLKKKPQIPSIGHARRGRYQGITWEDRWDSDTSTPYYKAIYDDQERIMVFICHNTDTGDGWEREGEDEWYFHEFSETQAYPLGINIVTYALTH